MGAAVQRSYNAEEIEAGLLELACWHGNSRQASRCLAERGLAIPYTTLQDWKRTHAERYEEIHAEVVPRVRDHLAQQYEQIGRRSAEIALDGLERFQDELKEVPIKDLAGAIRNIGVTGAVGVDKASLLRGLPTEIRQTESADEVLKRLQAKHPAMFVEGTVEEIQDAEVVDEKPRRGSGRELSRADSNANAPNPPTGSNASQPRN